MDPEHICWQILFQSTLPHGERHDGNSEPTQSGKISIHAPAWGATVLRSCRKRHMGYFNPRSRMGSDNELLNTTQGYLRFQSTLPHGERRMVIAAAAERNNISIHAPAWGATWICL